MTTLKTDMAFGTFDRKHFLHYIGKQIWMIVVGNMTHAIFYNTLRDARKRKEFLTKLCNLTMYYFDCHEYNNDTETFYVIGEKEIYSHIRERLKRCTSKKLHKALEKKYISQTNKTSYTESQMIENVIPDAIESFIPVLNKNRINIEDITVSSNKSSTSIAASTSTCAEQDQQTINHNQTMQERTIHSNESYIESNEHSDIIGLENCPLELHEIIMSNMIEMHIISMHKVHMNKTKMQQVAKQIMNYHTLIPFIKKSDKGDSENWLASILHNYLKPKQCGKPEAVDYSL